MSSTSPLQCLFCKHINSPGVSFCSVCDAQLDLQPCEQCGAVDNRAAKRCHKCGAEFALVAQSESGTEPHSEPFGVSSIYPAEKNSSVTRLMTTLPYLDSTPTATELRQMAARMPSEMGVTTTGAHRRWLFFGVPLLLSLIAISTYVIRTQPAKLPQQKQATQPLAAVSNESVPSTVVAPVESAVKPAEVKSTPPPKHSAPAKIEESGARQSSPPLKECPPEVATLGLCNPEIN